MKADKSSALSRRALIAILAAAAAAGTATAAPARRLARRAATPRRTASLEHAGVAEWTEQVGSIFLVRGEQGPARLKLVEVRRLHARGGISRRRHAFAAVFAPAGGALPRGDRTYPVGHSRHGRLDLFFGPAGDRLVAVFA
jgi:hypothetical protein